MMRPEDLSNRSDHDLLIRIETLLGELTRRFDSFSGEVSRGIGELEGRVRKLEDKSLTADSVRNHARYDAWGKEWEGFRNRLKGWYAAFTFVFVILAGIGLTLWNLFERLYAFGMK